jgi:hypothetical protein
MDQKFSYDYTGIKFKFYAPTTIKTVSGDDWIIRGYAATSDLDRQGDVIAPDALKVAAEDLKKNTTVFYEHKHDQPPVGKVLDAGVDKGGLWVEVMISKTRPDIWQLIQEGILNKFSIGGKVVSSQQKSEAGVNYNFITKMELFEVSIVGLPANANATFKEKSIVWSIRKAAEKKEKLNEALNIIEGGETKVADEKKVEDKKEEVKEETKVEETKAEQAGEVKVEKKEEVPVAGLEKKEEVIPPAEVVLEKKEEVKPEITKEEIKSEVKAEVVEKKEATVPTAEEAALAARAVAVGLPATATLAEVEAKEAEVAAEPETIDLEAELKEIKDTLATILTALSELKTKAEAKPLEKTEVVKEASLKLEDIQGIVVKALEDKLGKIRLVPSRKGTIVKLTKDLEQEGDEDLNTLMDEEKFKLLPKDKQQELIRKGLTSVILQ